MLLQTYKRDTGEILHDLSVPIMVNGRHWGGFRIGLERAGWNTIFSNQQRREMELEAVLLSLENKPELFIIDQLSSMLQSRDGVNLVKA